MSSDFTTVRSVRVVWEEECSGYTSGGTRREEW